MKKTVRPLLGEKMLNLLKDYSIIYSFDRSGYERHAQDFSAIDETKLRGKRFFITGGTSGIGEALAMRLLDAGAEVLVSGRKQSKFEASDLARRGAQFIALDMADFAAIEALSLPQLDGLVCNAGGMPERLTRVNEKYDVIFASQVVGHYVLLRKCIDQAILKPHSPIHITSSGGMYLKKLSLHDLAWREQEYDKVKSYANAKRAQVILNQELAQAYPNFHFSCSHPGWVGTQALAEALPDFVGKLGNRLRSAEQGADTIFWCLAEHASLPSGKFWFDRKARKETPFFWTRNSQETRKQLLLVCAQALQ